jgi:2-oxoisovalerate dehydrogenase E2 component (dihydrolipoyl transacylase)
MADIREFKLPDLGEGLEEGDIVEWHVAVGDVIELNQTVANIETAKAVVAVPSPFAGKVVELVGEVGETLAVGSVFVRIDVDVEGGEVADEAAGAAPEPAEPAEPAAEPAARRSEWDAEEEPQPLVGYGQGKAGGTRRRRRRSDQGAAEAPASDQPAEVLAKPPVRKLAKDMGVELAAIAPGSGPDGIITREDVQAAASGEEPAAPAVAAEREPAPAAPSAPSAPPEPAALRPGEAALGFRGRQPGEVEQIRGIRKRIVEKMEQSRREIPAASCTREADVTGMWQLARTLTAEATDQGYDVKITPFAMVMRATILGLRRFPTLNARIVGREDGEPGEIHLLEPIHLGFAADTDRGLVVPNVKDAHTKSLLELAAELAELAGKARDGSIGPGELTGGTFTVNNYGAFGNDDGEPILNHPEVGILGVGAMRERPWVVDGELTVRRIATLRLAFDHRACDGGEAGRFVTYVADLCEEPSRILLHA